MRYRSLPAILLLAGCAMAPKVEPVVNSCPPVRAYSQEFLNAAADELDSIANRAPHIAQMIVDYGAERRALRTCR